MMNAVSWLAVFRDDVLTGNRSSRYFAMVSFSTVQVEQSPL
jgi:hypothetical protein